MFGVGNHRLHGGESSDSYGSIITRWSDKAASHMWLGVCFVSLSAKRTWDHRLGNSNRSPRTSSRKRHHLDDPRVSKQIAFSSAASA